jgi:hypothetical protein
MYSDGIFNETQLEKLLCVNKYMYIVTQRKKGKAVGAKQHNEDIILKKENMPLWCHILILKETKIFDKLSLFCSCQYHEDT